MKMILGTVVTGMVICVTALPEIELKDCREI
jgi:hypothetical protein